MGSAKFWFRTHSNPRNGKKDAILSPISRNRGRREGQRGGEVRAILRKGHPIERGRRGKVRNP